MTLERTARFTVRPEELDRALETIGRFIAHTETEPGTLVYASWRSKARPYEFLHLMSFADAPAEQAHASSDAVRVFIEALYPMCVKPPKFEEWHAVWGTRIKENVDGRRCDDRDRDRSAARRVAAFASDPDRTKH